MDQYVSNNTANIGKSEKCQVHTSQLGPPTVGLQYFIDNTYVALSFTLWTCACDYTANILGKV